MSVVAFSRRPCARSVYAPRVAKDAGMPESVQSLREAASDAHRDGDIPAAVALFEKILDLFPDSAEAVDAVFYLSSIGKGRRRPPKRVVPG